LVTNGLDVVPIGITNERPEIVSFVLGPQARIMKDWCTEFDRDFEESTYGLAIRRDKGDVALAKAVTGLAWADPEFGLLIAAESDDSSKIP
jgi:NifB/MoaA-like Fe-S oxidoreductase